MSHYALTAAIPPIAGAPSTSTSSASTRQRSRMGPERLDDAVQLTRLTQPGSLTQPKRGALAHHAGLVAVALNQRLILVGLVARTDLGGLPIHDGRMVGLHPEQGKHLQTKFATTSGSMQNRSCPRTASTGDSSQLHLTPGEKLSNSGQLAAPMWLLDPARIERLLTGHFVAMLLASLIERTIRQAMTDAGLSELSLNPDDRGCAVPTTARILGIFTGVARHQLTAPTTPCCVPSTPNSPTYNARSSTCSASPPASTGRLYMPLKAPRDVRRASPVL